MRAAARHGIAVHETVWMIETAYKRLRDLDITGPMADRIVTAMVMRASGDTAGRSIEAANRLFPPDDANNQHP